MTESFPIEIPTRLPVLIDPCPIVEAIFEARFVTSEPWETIPGLLFAHVRERYPNQKRLPLAQVPEEVRRQDPSFQYRPLIQFFGQDFLIQLGPRVVGLVTKPHAYPGWSSIKTELMWIMERLRAAGFVGETERLSARYVDFFDGDVFSGLRLAVHVNERRVEGTQTDVTTVLHRGSLALRLQITNGAVVGMPTGPRSGSVLDVDAWFGALDVDLFRNGLDRFAEAHDVIKGLFFGLLKPEMLAKLNPRYE